MYNNNTTMFYIFIRDFGKAGVIIGSAILSFVFVKVLNKFNLTNKIIFGVISVYLATVLITGTMIYSILTGRSSISLIIILLILNRIKTRDDGEWIE